MSHVCVGVTFVPTCLLVDRQYRPAGPTAFSLTGADSDEYQSGQRGSSESTSSPMI